jgi:hypothetical protein
MFDLIHPPPPPTDSLTAADLLVAIQRCWLARQALPGSERPESSRRTASARCLALEAEIAALSAQYQRRQA